MELDKRIKEGKRPLTCFDLKEAEKFRGEDGYFAHEMEVFENLDCCYFSRLLGFDTCDKLIPFAVANASRDYEFFIPEEWIKEPEKKYRPFTLAEWVDQHEIGDIIHYRCKSQKIELRHMYMGYAHGIGTDIKNTTSGTLTLGVASYCLDYLFEDYEIEVDGEWQPFGVIDEEGVGK